MNIKLSGSQYKIVVSTYLESKRAVEIVRNLHSLFFTFGVPTIFLSDNGHEFFDPKITKLKTQV